MGIPLPAHAHLWQFPPGKRYMHWYQPGELSSLNDGDGDGDGGGGGMGANRNFRSTTTKDSGRARVGGSGSGSGSGGGGGGGGVRLVDGLLPRVSALGKVVDWQKTLFNGFARSVAVAAGSRGGARGAGLAGRPFVAGRGIVGPRR